MVGDQVDGAGIPTRTLVESMIREDASIDAGELYAVGNALGMSDQQVRLCVRRLVGEGQFTQEGRGRKALLRAGDGMRRSIEPEPEYIRYMYAQDRGAAPWDGVWHAVAFAVPESVRQGRDAMRDAIVYLGGAAIQGGLYVSPNAWESRIADAAREFEVGEYITTMTTTDLRIGALAEPRELAARLWPLERLAAEHERLLRVARRQLDRLHAVESMSQTERLTIAVELAAEFSRVMDPDPLLPPELLPTPWIGAESRAVVAQCWSELLRVEQPGSIRLFRVYADVLREAAAAR
ncbi:PaaX family transcriptional regulator C-terminal domain-containing protein [Nocardia inohanensis]|uniref:PaaX family transcriptional regulator C-terminal domain-containing protein n=1 Tax=Nocardia inohanensis TaxID=209246 RepID=UPI000829FE3B|nr:PaaX family transcriptional regulator C-terminal domain-containing protein [Nocardia inohanensis]